ncbi:MAG: outer membrane protein transport protein [Verrucomicrobia bacterium]|nr:outer membrane protein transport protein [Verrucomicrobiota bacterium]
MKYILAILLPLSLWGMNGLYQIGYGAQGKGMGGVAVALPQDSLVVAINPAGLSCLCKRVDIGLDWLKEEANTHLGKHIHSNQNFVFPELGLAAPLPCHLTGGLAFFRKGVLATDYGTPTPFGTSNPSFLVDQYYFTPSLAWAINSCHSVGVALNISYNRLEAHGLENLMNFSVHPSDVTNRGVDAEWGFGVTIGWLGNFMDFLTLGVSYETKNWVEKFARYRGLAPKGGNFSTPSTFWLGAACFLSDCFVLSTDFGYHLWNTVPAYGNTSNTNQPDGAASGPGLGWRNQFVFKLGAAFDFLPCWTARVGYNFGQQVVPTRELLNNTLLAPVVIHHITAGLSYAWQCHQFTLAYIHGFENKVSRSPVSTEGETDQVSLSWGKVF